MLDRILKLNPVRPGEDAVMSQFAGIGVGPGKVQSAAKPDAATIARAEVDAMKAIDVAGPRIGNMTNGWLVIAKCIGSYGTDYLQRASIWAGGPLTNFAEESLYPSELLGCLVTLAKRLQLLLTSRTRYDLVSTKSRFHRPGIAFLTNS